MSKLWWLPGVLRLGIVLGMAVAGAMIAAPLVETAPLQSTLIILVMAVATILMISI